MSDTVSQQRVTAVLVGIVASIVGIGIIGTGLVAFFIGGFKPVLQASGTALGVFTLLLVVVGVCMLVGATGLVMDTVWGWSVTAVAFGVMSLVSIQNVVSGGITFLPVVVAIVNLLVVAVSLQHASFERVPVLSPN